MQIMDLVPDLKPTIMAAREMRDPNNRLAKFLPTRNVDALSYRLGRRQRADQVVPIRAFDAPAVPIRRPGVVDVRGDLPAITPRVDWSEDDLNKELTLARQLAGQSIDWTNWVADSAARTVLTIDNTLEMMRGQALSALGLSLQSADGVVHEVSFGAAPEQFTTVTTKWGTSGSDPLKDFEAAVAKHLEIAGVYPQAVLTTAKAKRVLLQALQLKYPNQPIGANDLVTYLSNNDLPQIVTYDRMFTAYDQTKGRYFPEGTMTFLPSLDETVGSTDLGITQEAVQQTQRIQPNGTTALDASEVAGITVITLGQDDPVQRSVKAAAVGMPVIHEIDQVTVMRGLF